MRRHTRRRAPIALGAPALRSIALGALALIASAIGSPQTAPAADATPPAPAAIPPAANAAPPAQSARPASEIVISARMRHLRHGAAREWDDFPERAEAASLDLEFTLPDSPGPWTLRWRQRDVKQSWKLRIDDQPIATLAADENDQVALVELPPAVGQAGEHRLRIAASGPASDDIMLGDIRLLPAARDQWLSAARVSIEVTDARDDGPLPCRLTVVDQNGSLAPVLAAPDKSLAVRTGVIYTLDGRASFGLAAGDYTIYASRGFEYGVDSASILARPGDALARRLRLTREAAMPGYVACDTHCHTLTYSRHGDASIEERMITLAGEGVELPVATDHNIVVDYDAPARAAGARAYFTPLSGDEVTTRVGHFNVFPLAVSAAPIDSGGRDWRSVFGAIRQAPGARVIVLNHPRDIHGGFRPFDPARHVSLSGEDLEGWRLEANAVEVVNSGALRSDPLELVRDWLGMLNAGYRLTPIGSSDSHDVARVIVGQGRTYVRCRDDDPGKLDTAEALDSLAAGRVMVAFGLAAEITVDGRYGPGDLAPAQPRHEVRLRVLGPSWTAAQRVALLANGVELRAEDISGQSGAAGKGGADAQTDARWQSGTGGQQSSADGQRRGDARAGVKWTGVWTIDSPAHDVQLVAVALGPGQTDPFWPIARPYQPSSSDWRPYVLGLSGAARIDGDGDGRFTSPRHSAEALVAESGQDLKRLFERLAAFDEAVAVQAASLLRAGGVDPAGERLRPFLENAAPAVQRGFRTYARAWAESARAATPAGHR